MSYAAVHLGELVDILSGFAFKSNQFGDTGDLPVVCIRDVVHGESDTFYTGEYAEKFVVNDGDLLIGMDGEFNRERWRGGRSLLNQRVCRVSVTNGRLDEAYLYHFLPAALKAIERDTPFVTVKHLSARQIRAIAVPLPPIGEQRRIAAVLDAAEALRAKRRQALAKLDTLTQAIFIDMFGEPLTPASTTEAATLAEVASFVRGITFKSTDVLDEAVQDSVGVMRTANVQSDLDTTDVWQIPERFVKRDDQYLLPFDTLVSSANSWNLVGRCCLIPENLPRSSFGGFVTVLRPRATEVTPRYLHAWFKSSKVQQTVRSFGRRTTNISNLDLKRCGKLRIAVPPIGAQLDFEDLLNGIQGIVARHETDLEQLGILCASLEQRAFRGEL